MSTAMSNPVKYILSLFVIVIIFIFSAHPIFSKTNDFTKDAEALCEVYNPDNWRDYVEQHTSTEVYKELGIRINKAIVSDEFRDIFRKFLKEKHADFHHSISRQVSDLIGKPWQCNHFDSFYQVKYRKEIQLVLKGATKVQPLPLGEEIHIMVDKKGNFYVNNKLLKSQSSADLSRAIQLTASVKKPKIVIQSDALAPYQSLISIVDAARMLGISEISLETN